MSYVRTTVLDPNPGGTTRKQAILDLDTDLTGIFTNLNTHEALTTAAHGVTAGDGYIVGTAKTQTLTAKTISGGTITGAITATGATITSPTITAGSSTNMTLTTPTLSAPTITGAVTGSGMTLTGGTFSAPTITGAVTASGMTMSGGTLSAPTITGTVDVSGASFGSMTLSAPTITGILTLGTSIMTANYKAFADAAGLRAEWATGIKIGTLTRAYNAASGDVSYTGVGFKPSAILFLGVKEAGDNLTLSIGFSNGAADYSVFDNSASSAGSYGQSGTACIYLIQTAGKLQYATVKTFDDDGFTLTWTNSSGDLAANCKILYLALR